MQPNSSYTPATRKRAIESITAELLAYCKLRAEEREAKQ